jgi:hypothetical protein
MMLAGSIPFGFSWLAAFSLRKTRLFDRWISLDFLGFSRPNRDFSMGYAGFSLENFSSRFLLGVRSAGRDLQSREMKAQDCS